MVFKFTKGESLIIAKSMIRVFCSPIGGVLVGMLAMSAAIEASVRHSWVPLIVLPTTLLMLLLATMLVGVLMRGLWNAGHLKGEGY